MEKSDRIDKFYYFFPQTVAFVAVAKNVMPAAWHTPISAQPPLYGVLVAPKRYTFDLLKKENGFTVNFLEHKQAQISAQAGSISGRNIDKLEKLGIQYFDAEKVNGPILGSSYAAFECEKYGVAEYGDHHLFIGRIVLIHYRKDILDADCLVDEKNIFPMLYFGKDRYITTEPGTIIIHKRD
jgi:flavin reductase (DIM6/NTAB) family NADH-FMN oxidoreductase RutF